jgi:hypothetical protein
MHMFRCLTPAVDSSTQHKFDRIEEASLPAIETKTLKHSNSSLPFAPRSQSSSFPSNNSHSQLSSTWESSEPDTLLSASNKRMRRFKSQIAFSLKAERMSSASSAEQLARYFANSYLEAVAGADVKWASSVISKQFSDRIVLVAPDGGRFEGKSSVISRLNRGVDQMAKMTAGSKVDTNTIQTRFYLKPMIEESDSGAAAETATSKAPSLIARIVLRIVSRLMKKKKVAPPAATGPALQLKELKFKASYEWKQEGSKRSLRITDIITIDDGLIVSVVREMSI